MTNQAPELTSFDLIEWRRSKVLELHSQGLSEREISSKLRVSKTTVHNDLAELRKQAQKQLEDHIEGIPFAWEQARTNLNLLLKKAWEIAERKGLEFDQELDIIKTLNDLNESRLSLYADVSILERSAKNAQAMKKQIADLKKKAHTSPAYDVIETEAPAAGKKGKTITREFVKRKAKKEAFTPVV